MPPGGVWAPASSITLNQNGTPFWDQTSMDGANKNIGFQLQMLLGAGAPLRRKEQAAGHRLPEA